MNFWIDNLLNPPWEEWRNYKYNKIHLGDDNVNLKCWCDQDFLNFAEESKKYM